MIVKPQFFKPFRFVPVVSFCWKWFICSSENKILAQNLPFLYSIFVHIWGLIWCSLFQLWSQCQIQAKTHPLLLLPLTHEAFHRHPTLHRLASHRPSPLPSLLPSLLYNLLSSLLSNHLLPSLSSSHLSSRHRSSSHHSSSHFPSLWLRLSPHVCPLHPPTILHILDLHFPSLPQMSWPRAWHLFLLLLWRTQASTLPPCCRAPQLSSR